MSDMKRMVVVASIFLLAAAAYGQNDSTTTTADYSREKLLRLLAGTPEKPRTAHDVEFGLGTISFRALGTRWRIAYLPFFMPFPGTYMTPNRQWPDPFLLTGTEYASPPRTWRQARDMNAELRRIERKAREKDKERSKVTVKPQ